MFTHIQTCSGIIQAYSEPCVTVAYSEPWHIRNLGIFRTRYIYRTLVYSEPEVYSELCQTSKMECFAKIVNSYSCFRNISFPRFLLFYFFLQKYLFYVKRYSGLGGRGPWIFIYPRHI